MRSFFSGLRGKLILTYTLVTVLALMALEVLVILAALLISTINRTDETSYLDDVLFNLYPQARGYLQPGKENLPGLQAWLDQVAASGYASQRAINVFDSPAAAIVPSDGMLVLAPDGKVLAQTPLTAGSLVGRQYTPPADDNSRRIVDEAVSGSLNPLRLSMRTPAGKYRMAVPVMQTDRFSPVVGVILLTLEPAPPMIRSTWPVFVGWVLVTGVLLMIAVAPFGALFGYIMSRGLSRRLTALSRAADAWSEGDFQHLPADGSRDEIGVLGLRLRNMAERIQTLLHSQQELAILEERNRLARELHDTVKQQMFATLMQVRAARNLLASDPPAAEKLLTDAESLIKTSQQELGLMITELRPAALDGQGLAGALRAYLATWSEHTRIPATFQVSADRRMSLGLEQALYRVAQEALANVARHSRASAVTTHLEFNPDSVQLVIADNGVGFDPHQPDRHGFGLESMQARLAELDGRLEITSVPNEGTRITARAPLNGKGKTNAA